MSRRQSLEEMTEQWSQRPEWVNPRFAKVSLQGVVWVDAQMVSHEIASMAETHASSAYSYLRERCRILAPVWLRTVEKMIDEGDLPVLVDDVSELRKLAASDPRAWVEELPVMKALSDRFRPQNKLTFRPPVADGPF